MRLAVVDTEDARFWTHGGVDWVAAARDLEQRRVVEGGSTITQRYVKNSYVSGERTLGRKLAEAGHAWGLERRNGKEAILEAYLNTVYFGEGATGWRPPPRPTSPPGRTGSPCPRRPCWPG